MAKLWGQSDGKFSVLAWSEVRRERGRAERTRFRVRYGFVGGDESRQSASGEAEAVAVAEGIWRAYIDGMFGALAVVPTTIGELIHQFLDRGGLSPATLDTYEKTLRRFVCYIGGEERPLSHIGRGAVQAWFDGMSCNPRSKSSYRTTLRALFRWAVAEGVITMDPTAKLKLPKVEHTIRPWLQHFEWEPFLSRCSPYHKIRAEFVLHTGLRASELTTAKWSWLHGTVGRPAITVPASKSARARAIPLDRRAQELLEIARETWPNSEYIFFASKTVTTGNMRRDTVKACQRADVTVTDFHGLRRSCGARWLELGASLLEVSRLLGHASVSTTAKHYAGIADRTLAGVMDRVDAAADDQPVVRLPVRRRRAGTGG